MIVLDMLFKICFAPFQKLENGRIAAIIWLMQILSFILLALVNALLFVVGIDLSSTAGAIIGTLIGVAVYIFLDRIYLKNSREVGVFRFPFLMGVLIFIFLMASLFLLVISLARF